MSADDAVARFAELQRQAGPVDANTLAEIWGELPTLRTDELLGAWRGRVFDTGHSHNGSPGGANWHGKHFVSTDHVLPDVCAAADGSLYSDNPDGTGLASLWMMEFRGEVTASLVYDDQPIVDHFKRVDATTVLGIMNRKVDRDTGDWLYFWIEREDVPLLT